MASSLTALNVGAITKIVRKSAMPTSTWFGGAVGVPRPVRMKPRTMRIRVKPVTLNSSAGTSVIAAEQEEQLDGVAAVLRGLGDHARTVAWRMRSSASPMVILRRPVFAEPAGSSRSPGSTSSSSSAPSSAMRPAARASSSV